VGRAEDLGVGWQRKRVEVALGVGAVERVQRASAFGVSNGYRRGGQHPILGIARGDAQPDAVLRCEGRHLDLVG
jgi:hypothetical protein